MDKVLLDTSALFALLNSDDSHHKKAVSINQALIRRRVVLVLPNFLLAESHAILNKRLGPQAARAFLNAAVLRTGIKRNPFHPFSCFDTATLGGVAYGQTVLMRATLAAGLEWDTSSAHSAAYDAERSADLFCAVCNQFQGVFEASRRRLAAMGPLEVETEPALETPADLGPENSP